jgi:hypothetical protein
MTLLIFRRAARQDRRWEQLLETLSPARATLGGIEWPLQHA